MMRISVNGSLRIAKQNFLHAIAPVTMLVNEIDKHEANQPTHLEERRRYLVTMQKLLAKGKDFLPAINDHLASASLPFNCGSIVCDLGTISLVAHFDAFLKAVLRIVYCERPDIMLNLPPQIKKQLPKFSYEDILHNVTERYHVFDLMADKMLDAANGIRNKMSLFSKSLDVQIDPDDVRMLHRIYETRNLLVHNTGMTTEEYVKEFSELNLDPRRIHIVTPSRDELLEWALFMSGMVSYLVRELDKYDDAPPHIKELQRQAERDAEASGE
jgi:hypothetical protein